MGKKNIILTGQRRQQQKRKKPDRAKMRPDCVLTWSEIRADCVRQKDEQT